MTLIQIRKNLILNVFSVSKKLSLPPYIPHMAISYMDQIMQHQLLSKSKYYIFSIATLIISAKYYHLDIEIPFIEDYIQSSTIPITKENIITTERAALSMLAWKLERNFAYDNIHILSDKYSSSEKDRTI